MAGTSIDVYQIIQNLFSIPDGYRNYIISNISAGADGETYILLNLIVDDLPDDITRETLNKLYNLRGMIIRYSDSKIVARSYPYPEVKMKEKFDIDSLPEDFEFEEYTNGLLIRAWSDDGIKFSSISRIDISKSRPVGYNNGKTFLEMITEFIPEDSEFAQFLSSGENAGFTHTFMISSDVFQINTRSKSENKCIYLDSFENEQDLSTSVVTLYNDEVRERVKDWIDQNQDKTSVTYNISLTKDEAKKILTSTAITQPVNWASSGSIIVRNKGLCTTVKSEGHTWRDAVNGGKNNIDEIFTKNLYAYLIGGNLLNKVEFGDDLFNIYLDLFKSGSDSIYNPEMNQVRLYKSNEPVRNPPRVVSTNLLYSIPIPFLDKILVAEKNYENSFEKAVDFLYNEREFLMKLQREKQLHTLSAFGRVDKNDETGKKGILNKVGFYFNRRIPGMFSNKSRLLDDIRKGRGYDFIANRNRETMQPISFTNKMKEKLVAYRNEKNSAKAAKLLDEIIIKDNISASIIDFYSDDSSPEVFYALLQLPKKIASQRNADETKRLAGRK